MITVTYLHHKQSQKKKKKKKKGICLLSLLPLPALECSLRVSITHGSRHDTTQTLLQAQTGRARRSSVPVYHSVRSFLLPCPFPEMRSTHLLLL